MTPEQHEILEFTPYLPIKIFIHKLGHATRHWHQSLELLLVLEGNVTVGCDDQTYELQTDDIILINANSIHELSSESCIMVAVQIKPSMFDNISSDIDTMIFQCNSTEIYHNEGYNVLKYVIATLIKETTGNRPGKDYRTLSLGYYLISVLVTYFNSGKIADSQNKHKYLDRLARILSYINDHYQENFSLNDLAEAENLSVPYLSSFFNKYIGMNFSKYYTNIKLEHALPDLLDTEDSIETIALRHGFTEVHTFVRAFKKKYQTLPSSYRKEQKLPDKNAPARGINYMSIEPNNYLHLLAKYLDYNMNYGWKDTYGPGNETVIMASADTRKSIRQLKHNFKKFITVGRAKELLNADIQKMLQDIQDTIGYEYIKFHGILSDDMLVCSRQNGQLTFHFTHIEMVLDFLLSLGLKPLVQLSFMPGVLASDPDKNVCFSKFNTSPPADMNEWNQLIDALTRHLIDRYGLEQVLSWPFCVWNEPDTSQSMFGFSNDQDFYHLYKNTYDTVKSVHPGLQFGTPSLLILDNHSQRWVRDFLQWIQDNGCPPDFMNIHYYSDQIEEHDNDLVLTYAPTSTFPKESDNFSKFIKNARKLLKECGLSALPVYMTEWNFTFSHRNLLNDTCFKSCYIMKNLLENYDDLDSFAYWSLTDLLEETAPPNELFHGGMGIYTMNGLRKNVYYTFAFANQLGNELIARGDGYFITKKAGSYQIITYNYIHYSDLFADGELFDTTPFNRYTHFDMSRTMEVSLTLEKILPGNYLIKEYYVNTEFGSAFDVWLGCGGQTIAKEDYELMKAKCVPAFHQYRCHSEGTSLNYATRLTPLEIRLAIITPSV